MKKIGLKDVAEHVGVSTALVSYVLNGQADEKQVNKETAERILQAAQALNYRPNQIAKSLKMRKTHTIGLIVADINYRFSTGITRAIEEEARKYNYTVIYGSSNENKENLAELINVLINRRVDGLIVVPVEHSEPEIKKLQSSDVPFVLVDRNFPSIQTNYIALDNYKAAFNATSYLISRGLRKIAMINYQTSMFHLLERNRGYRDALTQQGIDFQEDWLQPVSADNRVADVQHAIDRIVSESIGCDAVFFATDTLAINGLKYMAKLGIQIPQTMSVLSFDESEAFDLFYIPVTHSRQPLAQMGKLAVETLLNQIDHTKIHKQLSLEADLIIGKSCL